MRFKKSVINGIIAMLMYMINIIVAFIAQKIFVIQLGKEYLGINGLFSNIVNMLAVVELGVGAAITFNLYKPIAEKDIDKINSLMLFYKKSYRIIALIVLILGFLVMPFIPNIVGIVTIKENLYFIFALFIIDIVASYLLTYKRSMLYANQENYIVNLVHIGYIMLMNITQIVMLYLTNNFIVYLVIKIICRILENIVITLIANKMYPFLNNKNTKQIDKDTKTQIIDKVKGLFCHKIGGAIVFGTDNILIAKFMGVVVEGLYSNYNLILNALTNLVAQIFYSITAIVGNLLIEEDSSKSYEVYKNMLFMNSWIYTFISAGILCLIQDLVLLWLGKDFILEYNVIIVLDINFYVQGMRKTINTFKEAAGIFKEDWYVPLIESLVNIIASIIFIKLFGLMGVFLGTIVSTGILYFYSFPIIVYKEIFKRSYTQFIKEIGKYYIIAFITIAITAICVNKVIFINNIYLEFIIRFILVCLIPNIIYIIIFRNKSEFKYYKEKIKYKKIQK